MAATIVQVVASDGEERPLSPPAPPIIQVASPPIKEKPGTKPSIPKKPKAPKATVKPSNPTPIASPVIESRNPRPLVVEEPEDLFGDATPGVAVQSTAKATATSATPKSRKVRPLSPPTAPSENLLHNYLTKLSKGERQLAIKFAGAKPEGYGRRWSPLSYGLRQLIQTACDALKRNPELGKNVSVPPGTISRAYVLRVPPSLHQQIEAVRSPGETDYALIKRLIQVGANAKPKVRDGNLV